MRKGLKIAVISTISLVGVVVALAVYGATLDSPAVTAEAPPSATVAAAPATTKPAAPAHTTPAAPKLTVAQRNAVAKAKEYLSIESFSRSGLIKQLEYDGFAAADATYGVDHSGADWTVQADAKAKEYLSIESFSRSGLIKQLEYDGFTASQAQHGASAAGL